MSKEKVMELLKENLHRDHYNLMNSLDLEIDYDSLYRLLQSDNHNFYQELSDKISIFNEAYGEEK